MKEIVIRHRKEQKDLVSRATGMKKQANKKTRKRVLKQIRELEEEMKERHTQELIKVEGGNDFEEDNVDVKITPEMLLAQLEIEEKKKSEEQAEAEKSNDDTTTPTPRSHRNRQRERIARRNAELKEKQEQARLEAERMPNPRDIELKNISDLCRVNHLQPFEITPDGHCLFASIADQLMLRHEIEMSVQELRTKAAEYIRSNPDTFTSFLFDEKTMRVRDISDYTRELETTAMWGGDLEILALSKVFDCPISVMMGGREPLKMNEDGQQPELKIVYYQHTFGLGEHYNSLRDESKSELKPEPNTEWKSVSKTDSKSEGTYEAVDSQVVD
ncbi:hypothetical protein FOA43_001106 [Brettanomyces nanus]|uniref:OTU domain-containing protein n=1 Tax=Eeniella nana TaxID=13502 RepID=A0A875S105_EENNA|nr:uncharacterized protein FOA43_001106 [Brettanomyces nanus]QPG73792.1 hypothetical protein FOA43_001106 [Brettanomyces nanus]